MEIKQCRFWTEIKDETGRHGSCLVDPSEECNGFRHQCPRYASSAFTNLDVDGGPQASEIREDSRE